MWNLIWLMASTPVLALTEQPVPYSVAPVPWPSELGSQRAVVRVDQPAEAVRVHIAWRRHDSDPAAKHIVVASAASGAEIADVAPARVTPIAGDIVFRPAEGAGIYYVYYLPFTTQVTWGWYGGAYTPPRDTADPAWRARNGLTPEQLAADGWSELPEATVTGIESRTEFSRLDPMLVVATPEETAALLEAHPEPYLVFPEDRSRPVWMTDALPLRWIEAGPSDRFRGEAERDEAYAFQLALYAARQGLERVTVAFGDLVSDGGATIPAGALHCINQGGTEWTGEPLALEVGVAPGAVQSLWCLLAVPPDAAPGSYRGEAIVRPANAPERRVALEIVELDRLADNRGFNDLARFARLAWLDSAIAQDEEVTAPYTPLALDGDRIGCLGREVELGDGGLPRRIRSGAHEILSAPLRFDLRLDGAPVAWRGDRPEITHRSDGAISWRSESASEAATLACAGRMEYDGWVHYTLTLRANRALEAEDMALELPFRREAAEYLMGIGHDGGLRPKEWAWKWGGAVYNDSFWMGGPTAGIHCELRGASYCGPMVNLYWRLGQLSPPDSWNNGGLGGCSVTEEGEASVLARAFGGPRKLAEGEELTYEFALLITPVKPLDTAKHFAERYCHDYRPVESVKADGGNIINIHHGNEINPYINYPFLKAKELGDYVGGAHDLGMRVKLYYTLREVTNHIAELPALRSLGHEVVAPGVGGGFPWLQEHLGSDYQPSWYQPLPDGDDCASIVNSGASRGYNYYLEGLQWLVRYTGIDGLYVDDVSYDRRVMRRVRKILDRNREGCLIDLHSNTGFSMGPANQYMEFFPFIDRLWFGESFDYNRSPDYWLTEISGIPYGMMGDMLQNGGNPWRGMIYGMTARYPWTPAPREMWKVWDEFGIGEAEMLGYWEPNCPVRSDNPDVLATAYVRQGRTLISVASWAKGVARVKLTVDWAALGLDPAKAHLYAPAVAEFQDEALFAPDATIPVPPGRGWVLIADETPRPDVPVWSGLSPDKARESRTLLWEEQFDGAALPAEWTERTSGAASTRIAVRDGGVAIHCEVHRSAYIERALPPGTTMVEALVNPGDDQGMSWGIGLGLGFGERFLRVNLRAIEGRVGVDALGQQTLHPLEWSAPGEPSYVRIVIDGGSATFEASADGEWWTPLQSVPRWELNGEATLLRIGKMSGACDAQDAGQDAPEGDCRIEWVRAYGG